MVKVLVAFVILMGIFVVGSCVAVVGINNNLVAQEEGLKAQYKQNQNVYDNYWKKLKEASQVPDMYVSDLKKVFDSAMNGRYGEGGSKAVLQMLTEQNPQLSPDLYKQIQQMIEAGRNDFSAAQTMLLDKKMVYEKSIRTFPNSMIAPRLGFPKIDLSKIDIVTSEETEKVFETKKSEPINLR